MYVIGLMGGIASGKSNISRYLARRGAQIIDADVVTRELQRIGRAGYLGIRAGFGDEFFADDGELLRAALAAYVFGNEARLKKLNDIMLPLIDEEIARRIEKARKTNKKLVVIDAAILYESTAINLCDEVWLAMADKNERIRRIQERNGLSRESAQARIDSQKPDAELLKRADHVIVTEGTFEQTYAIVDDLLRQIGAKLAAAKTGAE
ncbi:MAG: dephospho-CoA kinase [Eubacteriales bacterium]|nr:dephospho-CoA kinase [Eubacteriales bacterium]